ncbi:nucleoside triphosphate hydrolase [Antarctobacter heliothermus]|uniref:AAA ATPase domain-containing protein n=1 Tax=Antarctobacter heliothermus TaxID=74033 RepID=A0A239J7X5_9RHOB|nr:nucleoside triphosphate hydrolase [Antarctobacter heliothermus]SNT01940.1 AAA ATPase domain-containing protein [Antarctobacter heliothermus]
MIPDTDLQQITDHLSHVTAKGRRMMLAVAGPPGSGKSTLAEALVGHLGPRAVLMPMDGFHLDNRLLEPRGLLPRKGAPESFDFDGLKATLARVAAEPSVLLPVFDRSREIAIAGAQEIGPDTDTVVVEGNYLCFAETPWDSLMPLWDATVFLEVPEAELERRLISRWLGYGYAPEDARQKALSNDIPNARRVLAGRAPVDVVVHQT